MSLSANQRPHKRLHEYFAVVGLPAKLSFAPDQSPLEVLRPLQARYMMGLLDRFPRTDHEDTPFPTGVPLFCLPCGLRLTEEMMMPSFSTFVHTGGAGQHLYGHCLTIHEPLTQNQRDQLEALMVAAHEAAYPPTPTPTEPEAEAAPETDYERALEPEPEARETDPALGPVASEGPPPVPSLAGKEVLAPKCLVVLSYWPHHQAYREWLKQLYRVSLSSTHIPLERYVGAFLQDVPLPPPGRILVQVLIADQTISFHTPPANAPMSWSALPYEPLFECLAPEQLMRLFTCLLLEKQIVLISSQQFLLSTAAEALTSLLYPLRWSHVYIPILPAPLFGVFHAPMPFLIGLHTEAITYGLEQQRLAGLGPMLHHDSQEGCDVSVLAAIHHSTNGSLRDSKGSLRDPAPEPPAKVLDVDEASARLMPDGVVRVFLDEGRIDLGTAKLPLLPDRRLRKLLQALETHADLYRRRTASWHDRVLPFYDNAFHHTYRPCDAEDIQRELDQALPFWKRPFHSRRNTDARRAAAEAFIDGAQETYAPNWNELREAFLRFFVALLRDYRRFLVMPTVQMPHPVIRFRKGEFLAAQTGDRQPLLKALVETQNFNNFVDERCWPDDLTTLDIDLFDEAIDAKKNRSKVRLKNRDTPFLRSARYDTVGTYVVYSPDAGVVDAALAEAEGANAPASKDADLVVEADRDGRLTYTYRRFPCLNPSRMPPVKPLPVLWKEEDDPRHSRSLRLRKSPVFRMGNTGSSGRGDGGDISFDEAVLATFIVAYSASVGLGTDVAGGLGLGLGLSQVVSSPGPDSPAAPEPEPARPPASEALGMLIRAASSSVELDSSRGSFRKGPRASPTAQSDDGPLDAGAADEEADGLFHSDAEEERRAKLNMMLDVAFEVVESVLEVGFRLDAHAYQSLIHACGRCGNVERALEVLDFLERANIQVTSVLYNAVLRAFAMKGGSGASSANLAMQMLELNRRLCQQSPQRFWSKAGADSDPDQVPLAKPNLHLIGPSIRLSPAAPVVPASKASPVTPPPRSSRASLATMLESQEATVGAEGAGEAMVRATTETTGAAEVTGDMAEELEAPLTSEVMAESTTSSDSAASFDGLASSTTEPDQVAAGSEVSSLRWSDLEGVASFTGGARETGTRGDESASSHRRASRSEGGLSRALFQPGPPAHSDASTPPSHVGVSATAKSPSFWDRFNIGSASSPRPEADLGETRSAPTPPTTGKARAGMGLSLSRGLGLNMGLGDGDESDDSTESGDSTEKSSQISQFLRAASLRPRSAASAEVAPLEDKEHAPADETTPLREAESADVSSSGRRRRGSCGPASMGHKDEVWSLGHHVETQVLLGEKLLELLYPNLEIDTSVQSCPTCGAALSEEDIFDAFPADPNVYTIRCPRCDDTDTPATEDAGAGPRPFVARFRVCTSAPEFRGSSGPETPLYCEWLSPWTLHKEIIKVVAEDGVETMVAPAFREAPGPTSTLWWNLVAYLQRYSLPVTFLLSGSFNQAPR